MAEIPFTQFHLPFGRKTQEAAAVSDATAGMAAAFIERGGWFEAEVLPTGDVSLTACWNMPDGDNDIEMEVVPNDAAVPDAIDRLVARAVARTDLP